MELSLRMEYWPLGRPEPPAPGRGGILALEQAMCALPGASTDPEHGVTHHFAPGLYARQIDLKAGECLVGKIHKHAHLAMLVCGEMLIADEHGVQRMTGPRTFVSSPGAKRAGYAVTDASFIVFHPTEKTNVAEIEQDVIAPSYEAFDAFVAGQLEALQ